MDHKPAITAYIFDMVGVLFSLNKKLALKHLGFRSLLLYCLRNKSNPFHDGMMLLNRMRLEVPGEFQESFTYKQYLMPQSLGLWQQGLLDSAELIKRISTYFDRLDQTGHFLHPQDKMVLEKMLDLMIDPALSSQLLQPIPSAISVLKTLHNRHIPCFLLSNISTDIFASLLAQYPAIFKLFTGITTSCTSQLLKPSPAIFIHLLEKNHLSAASTCFIDDQIENIETAKKLGLHTILCANPKQLASLIKLS